MRMRWMMYRTGIHLFIHPMQELKACCLCIACVLQRHSTMHAHVSRVEQGTRPKEGTFVLLLFLGSALMWTAPSQAIGMLPAFEKEAAPMCSGKPA